MATARSTDSSTSLIGATIGSSTRSAQAGNPLRTVMSRGLAVMFALVVVVAAILGTTQAPASAAPVPGSVIQCNGVDNQGGRAVECDVTITNYLDVSTGVSSSVIEVRTCSNFAGEAPTCSTVPASFPTATTVVDQCNGSGTGNGATVFCRVTVVNNIIGNTTLSPATIRQCEGSGQGGGIEPTLNCNPLETTTGAAITQCNGSANGGGASRRVTCTVEPSTLSTALPVSINQCNGSAAAGSLVTCTASLTHRILTAGTIVPAPTQPPVAGETPVPTDTGTPVPTQTPTPSPTAPPVTTSPTPTPSATAPYASPLIPTAGGGTGNGYGTELAETGTDAQPLFMIAAGAVLLGGILLAVILLRRRSDRATTTSTSTDKK